MRVTSRIVLQCLLVILALVSSELAIGQSKLNTSFGRIGVRGIYGSDDTNSVDGLGGAYVAKVFGSDLWIGGRLDVCENRAGCAVATLPIWNICRLRANGVYDAVAGGVAISACAPFQPTFYNGAVFDMEPLGATLFVAGQFNFAGCGTGTVATRNVARWNGSQWLRADVGLPSNSTSVTSLTTLNGTLYCVCIDQVDTCVGRTTFSVYSWSASTAQWTSLGQRFVAGSPGRPEVQAVTLQGVSQLWLNSCAPELSGCQNLSPPNDPFGNLGWMPVGGGSFGPFRMGSNRCPLVPNDPGPVFTFGLGNITPFGSSIYLSGGRGTSEPCTTGSLERYAGPLPSGIPAYANTIPIPERTLVCNGEAVDIRMTNRLLKNP